MRKNTDLIFRAMEPGDEYLLFEMENRPEAFRLGETRIPYSLDFLRHFIESSLADNFLSSGQLRLIACLPPVHETDSKPNTKNPVPDNNIIPCQNETGRAESVFPASIASLAESASEPGKAGKATSFWAFPPVGILDFYNYEALHSRAEIGILLCPEYRHQGLGQKIISQACSYAQNQLNLHQLYAQVRSDNPFSLKLFENCGFARCDYRKDWIRAGNRWIDVIGLQRIL